VTRSNAGARLSAYLEGDLSTRERSKLESQLADDPAMRETLRELENVVGLLRDLPEPEVPPAFSTRVIARVQEQREQASGGLLDSVRRLFDSVRRLFEPAVAVPLAAGITALALVIGSQQGIEPPADALDAEPLEVAAVLNPTLPPMPTRADEAPKTELVSTTPRDMDEMTLTEIQRHTLQTILARHPHEDLARLLRGSGHPHAASFATQVVDIGPSLVMVSHGARLGARRR
jgi:hypothetical protein